MEITRSQIEDRRAELERNRETIRDNADAALVKAQADISAHNGAIENCDWLLAKFDESEATSQKEDEGLDKIPVSRPVKREG
jgi:hypothetical protein